MAFTTLSGLVSTITGMSVTGVKRKVSYRPKQINSSDLPLLYTRIPTRRNEISTLGYGQDLKRATVEVVVIVEMLNLNTQSVNDALTVTLIDALADALETNAAALGLDSYDVTTEEDTINDGTTPVQAIIATVEVSG